jgi:phage terminase large subunit
MKIEFRLTPKQIDFFKSVGEFPVTFYGGARGGGKSYAVRAISVIKCLQVPNYRVGFFRKTFPELRSNHIDPLFAEHPELAQFYNSSSHTIKFPNGSLIEFNHCQEEKSVFLYQGREYHLLIIDEVGQWPEQWFWTLLGSNRSSNEKIKACCLLTGNPGGIGHKWLKRIFIDKKFRKEENPADYNFISAKVQDCPPLIKNDPKYVERLMAEPNEMRRRAFLDGDWTVFAGQFFDNFRTDIHVVSRDYVIEKHWQKFGGFDLGFNHPFVFGAYAVDEDGVIIKFAECGDRGYVPENIIKEVKETFPEVTKWPIYAGHDCWSKGRDGSKAVVEVFQNAGLNMVRANINRKQGAMFMRMLLDWEMNKEKVLVKKPKLYIMENCWRTIKCVPFLIVNDKDPEDVLKINATEDDVWAGDDAYDETRMAIMSRYSPSTKEELKRQRHTFGWFVDKMNEAENKKIM